MEIVKIRWTILELIFVVLLVGNVGLYEASAEDVFEHTTYTATTDKQFTVVWDKVNNAIHYGIRLYNFERDDEIFIPPTKDTSITLGFQRSGHYVVKVRACNEDYDPPCSPWSESTNPDVATVDGKPKGWWLYGYTAPPGEIIMENP